jgi:hypothetical protein
MEKEKQTKAQMQSEIEAMKAEYDDKVKALEHRAKTAAANGYRRSHSIDAQGNVVMVGPDPTSPVEVLLPKKEMSTEQQAAMEK